MLDVTVQGGGAPSRRADPRRDALRQPAAPRTAAVLSVATALPEGRLTTSDLAPALGVSEDWILSRTGIRERRRAAPDERLSDFAALAGRRALAAAGLDAVDIDLVIVATMSADDLSPNAAPVVAHAIGAHRAGAFDVGAACTAFLSGLAVGAAQIECGRARYVLLVGADFLTRLVDYTDRRTAPLFADGAGAVLLGPGDGGAEIGPLVLGSDGSQATTIQITHAERRIRMDGPEVFRHAVARMSEATLEACALAGVGLDEIDLFVYHQANARITRALGERLELPAERVVDCIEMFGNTSAATLPMALEIALREDRLRPGSRVLLSAFGAGFTYGAGVVSWGGPRV